MCRTGAHLDLEYVCPAIPAEQKKMCTSATRVMGVCHLMCSRAEGVRSAGNGSGVLVPRSTDIWREQNCPSSIRESGARGLWLRTMLL